MHVLHDFSASAERPEDRADEEAVLIEAASGGDAEAFAMLFRRFRPRIFFYAGQYFAPGSDRDDLLQEATIGFYKAIRDYKGDHGSFSAFVGLCVRRQVITFIKKSTRRKHAVLNWAKSLDVPINPESHETLLAQLAAPVKPDAGIDLSTAELLDELFERCSGLERNVLSMYSGGYESAEMARELGVHLKAIENAVWRVKVKARKLFAECP